MSSTMGSLFSGAAGVSFSHSSFQLPAVSSVIWLVQYSSNPVCSILQAHLTGRKCKKTNKRELSNIPLSNNCFKLRPTKILGHFWASALRLQALPRNKGLVPRCLVTYDELFLLGRSCHGVRVEARR